MGLRTTDDLVPSVLSVVLVPRGLQRDAGDPAGASNGFYWAKFPLMAAAFGGSWQQEDTLTYQAFFDQAIPMIDGLVRQFRDPVRMTKKMTDILETAVARCIHEIPDEGDAVKNNGISNPTVNNSNNSAEHNAVYVRQLASTARTPNLVEPTATMDPCLATEMQRAAFHGD
jgi:hypothetical protein